MLKSIKIFDSVYKITWVKEKKEVNPKNVEEPLVGMVDHFTNEIRIFNSMSSSQKNQTLFHEILHILIRELRIVEIDDSPRAEDIIDLLAMGLMTIIVDNGLSYYDRKEEES